MLKSKINPQVFHLHKYRKYIENIQAKTCIVFANKTNLAFSKEFIDLNFLCIIAASYWTVTLTQLHGYHTGENGETWEFLILIWQSTMCM